MTPEEVFTDQEIAAIEQIVQRVVRQESQSVLDDDGLQGALDYHSVPEIRALIQANLPELVSWLGHAEFDISVLRHALARKVAMRPGDKEVIKGSRSGACRWDNQVLNAVGNGSWSNPPIVPGEGRRRYKVADHVLKQLDQATAP